MTGKIVKWGKQAFRRLAKARKWGKQAFRRLAKARKWGKQAFRRLAKARKICPRPAEFCEQPLRGLPAKGTALQFFKSDWLLG